MFDATEREVPLWLPVGCFLVAAILYLIGRFVPGYDAVLDYWWTTLPLAFLSLSVRLRSRGG